MKILEEKINWKGIRDYLIASRILSDVGSIHGPRFHCQGLALELALKYYLWDKQGSYPNTHNLENLAFVLCQEIPFLDIEINGIELLNAQYLNDGEFYYAARYRPNHKGIRVVSSIGQKTLESVIEKIIKLTSTPELAERILRLHQN